MKKVLVTLLVFAVAVSGVFAAVNFSGSLTSGYVIQNNGGSWSSWVFGDDNTDSNSTTLKVNIADENGYWSSTLEGALYVDGSHTGDGHDNRVAGDITVDLAKIIAGPETDWSAQIQLLAFDRITALRAYTNKSGLNFDRVRTNEPGVWANAIVGYGKLIQFQIGGAPALSTFTGATDPSSPAGIPVGGTAGDFIISAMTEPLDGLRVSVDWALKGDKITDYGNGVVLRIPREQINNSRGANNETDTSRSIYNKETRRGKRLRLPRQTSSAAPAARGFLRQAVGNDCILPRFAV